MNANDIDDFMRKFATLPRIVQVRFMQCVESGLCDSDDVDDMPLHEFVIEFRSVIND